MSNAARKLEPLQLSADDWEELQAAWAQADHARKRIAAVMARAGKEPMKRERATIDADSEATRRLRKAGIR